MNRTHLAITAALLAGALNAGAQNTPPVVTNPIANFTVYAGAPQQPVELATAFADTDVSAAIRLNTVLGPIDLALFGQQKPITVANFLNYVNQGRYFIDRSDQRPVGLKFRSSIHSRIHHPRRRFPRDRQPRPSASRSGSL